MGSDIQGARKQLMDDFSQIVTDAEGLLKAVRDLPGEKAGAMRAAAEARLGAAKERLRDIQDNTVEKATAAAKAADTYVHDNPWPLIGAAALVGFVIGISWSRDRD